MHDKCRLVNLQWSVRSFIFWDNRDIMIIIMFEHIHHVSCIFQLSCQLCAYPCVSTLLPTVFPPTCLNILVFSRASISKLNSHLALITSTSMFKESSEIISLYSIINNVYQLFLWIIRERFKNIYFVTFILSIESIDQYSE